MRVSLGLEHRGTERWEGLGAAIGRSSVHSLLGSPQLDQRVLPPEAAPGVDARAAYLFGLLGVLWWQGSEIRNR